jgi:hypothetical protein
MCAKRKKGDCAGDVANSVSTKQLGKVPLKADDGDVEVLHVN